MKMKMLAKAIALAATAFVDKVDKGGKPYILHCLYVMDGGDTEDEKVADTEILKINLDGKAQEYELYKKMSAATDNASRWMKDSTEMRSFNESLKQIDQSLDQYTANIEDFKRNVLPKMSSSSTSKELDAQEGAALIEQYKKTRLQIEG